MTSLRSIFVAFMMLASALAFIPCPDKSHIRKIVKYFNGNPRDVIRAAEELFSELNVEITEDGFYFNKKITAVELDKFRCTKTSYYQGDDDDNLHHRKLKFKMTRKSNGETYEWIVKTVANNVANMRAQITRDRYNFPFDWPKYYLCEYTLEVI